MSDSRPELLVVADLPAWLQEPWQAEFLCHDWVHAPDREALLSRVAPRIRGVVTHAAGVVEETLLARLPGVEIVACFGVGYDGIPLAHCRSRGLRVSNTPEVLTDDTADIAVALLLMLCRDLLGANRHLATGQWPRGPAPLATAMAGKRVGILGLGRIGKAIARRLEAFGCILAYQGRQPQEVPYRYYPELRALARASDALVVACPGGAATRHLVDAEVLEALGAKGWLVNIARGSVVDEDALIAALHAGTIRGAALDVYAHEPMVPQALIDAPGVVLLPHVGSATRETRLAMSLGVLCNLRAHFAGEPLPTPVPGC
ncbi:MAG: 2-hydroxyacid dehydrogenase [Betaproteobacteria bacterium]|jgi:lactate dehydrogenase-like 2-hydroxyacid dehydrogenase|nr:2-hydroxyacid dehydrogenase [Betaproteobacteria bacterium]